MEIIFGYNFVEGILLLHTGSVVVDILGMFVGFST